MGITFRREGKTPEEEKARREQHIENLKLRQAELDEELKIAEKEAKLRELKKKQSAFGNLF